MSAPAAPGWRPAPRRPTVGRNEVQVWRTEVPGASQVAAAVARLPAAERERAAAMRNLGARSRFVAGRALLAAVRARLADDGSGLALNLSHSAALALLAVARGRRVGVDVERLRPQLDVAGVARLALSTAEAAAVAAADGPDSERAAFFACWARKEAYLKARGEGLPGRLRQWSVVPAEGGLYMPLLPGDPALSRRWRIRSLALGDGYAGAVAYEGEAELTCFRLEG